jgi:hypothetical protein
MTCPINDWQPEFDKLKAAAKSAAGQCLKYDEGKIDVSLVEPWIEEELARVYEVGLTKYCRDSWKEFELEDARKLIAPAKRHLNQYRKGEFLDPDDGRPHLVKAAWNLLTIYWHEREAICTQEDGLKSKP